jgi:hypothetical protein
MKFEFSNESNLNRRRLTKVKYPIKLKVRNHLLQEFTAKVSFRNLLKKVGIQLKSWIYRPLKGT